MNISSNLQYTFNKHDTDPFDDWFSDTHGTELEEDVDDCVEDNYGDGRYE